MKIRFKSNTSKSLLSTILFLGLFFWTTVITHGQDHLVLEAHADKFKNAKVYTIQTAELLPEEKFNFRPVEDEMSFKQQLLHLDENIYWLTSTYIREEPNPIQDTKPKADGMSKEEVIDFVKSAYDYAITGIESSKGTDLSKEFKWAGGTLTKYKFLNLIQDHQTHHRAQLMVYLRLNQINPPKYIGW